MNVIAALGQSPYVAAAANAIQIASGLGAALAWWHLSCDIPWCWRHGRLADGPRHYCAKHHPDHGGRA